MVVLYGSLPNKKLKNVRKNIFFEEKYLTCFTFPHHQGDEMLMEIYKELGGPEVSDQLEVTRRLLDLYPFIDRSRVGIWGWSYGGFVTLSVLAKDAEDGGNTFK